MNPAILSIRWPTEVGLFEALTQNARIWWRNWPVDMTAKRIGNATGQPQFSLSGTCPHCNLGTVMMPVSSTHTETAQSDRGEQEFCRAVMQCQGCMKYVLGAAVRSANASDFRYVEHFPLGKPNDSVPAEIPANIAADFSEALRCRFVDAHNATVEMCRRAVQASCFQMGAPDEKLVKQIDWIASQGKITAPLKEMAHRVRLGGNLGAHPPEDPSDPTEITINGDYADAVIEFTRDFFQHVYVMPEKLRKCTFKK